jgi:hypothetical protein
MKLKLILRNFKNIFFDLIVIERLPFIWPFFVFILLNVLKTEPLILSFKYKLRRRIFKIKAHHLSENGKVCHIFGNGMSVMKSCRIVNQNDFVIKINSGVFIPVHTNIWMTELHGKNEATEQELKLGVKLFSNLTKIVKEDSPNVILLLKNIWTDNVSPGIYDPNSEFFILQDFLLRGLPSGFMDICKFRELIIKALVSDRGNIIGQMHTSLLTALILSHRLGFKRIVVHGLDGCGSHFFHDSYFDNMTDHIRVGTINALRNSFPEQPNEVPYRAGLSGRAVINDYIRVLNNFGVEVNFGLTELRDDRDDSGYGMIL